MESIAGTKEILETLTAFLRGEAEGGGARERLRAAELLGKRFGLFESEAEEGGGAPVVITGGDELR
ncbi:MAG: hypothetical protein FWG72_10900 [Oscillospiraceae bacterium]|nr:hypothetical protein [Oscillospiraceae bacterium]